MKIRCLFIQRKQRYDGEFLPELLAAACEATLDENPEYFPRECETQLKDVGDEAEASVVVDVEIDGKELDRLLSVQALKGTIAPAEE